MNEIEKELFDRIVNLVDQYAIVISDGDWPTREETESWLLDAGLSEVIVDAFQDDRALR